MTGTPEPLTTGLTTFLSDLFTAMAENKALPKYQLERRIDSIISLFLPDILQQMHPSWGTIDRLVPEFPLKKGSDERTTKESNQSTNVDQLLFRHGTGTVGASWLFFELKTDDSSVDVRQLRIYLNAMQHTLLALESDLHTIKHAAKPPAKKKYEALITQLDTHKLLLDRPIELVYLVPNATSVKHALAKIKHTNPALVAAAEDRKALHLLSFGDLTKITLPHYAEAWAVFSAQLLPVLGPKGGAS